MISHPDIIYENKYPLANLPRLHTREYHETLLFSWFHRYYFIILTKGTRGRKKNAYTKISEHL